MSQLLTQKNTRQKSVSSSWTYLQQELLVIKQFLTLLTRHFLSPFTQYPEVEGEELDICIKATDHELGVNVAFNATSWLSLVYDFKNTRQPDIQDESQITHSFLATTAYAMKGTW